MKTFFVLCSLAISGVMIFFGIGAYYANFYPMKYRSQIEYCGDKYQVDSALIASVINVESNFKEDVISNKGAIGIMQLMPSTAKWLAEKTGQEYNDEKLLDVEYSIDLGSFYLSFLIEYFDDEKLGICAYNAGQGNVSAWLKDDRYSSDGRTLKNIPFPETRQYLKRVLNNYNYYKNKYN